MKKLTKIVILSLLFLTATNSCFCKTSVVDEDGYFEKALASLKQGVDWIPQFLNAFKEVDKGVNKDKAKTMAVELTRGINNLILAKQAFIFEVQANKTDFRKQVDSMGEQVKTIAKTTNKYNDLITAMGLKATNIQYSFYNDLMVKKQTLDGAATFLKGHPSKDEVQKKLVDYLKNCIKILETSKTELAKFDAL